MTALKRSLAKRWKILTDRDFRNFRKLIRRFNREQGRGTPARFSDITSESVVLDLGGYEGEWAAEMRNRYDCFVHVFEPHPRFVDRLVERFSQDAKITVHPYALASSNGELKLSDSDDASSAILADDENFVLGRTRDAIKVMTEYQISSVAACKINIEGGEYDILPYLIETGLITRFNALAIQFHRYEQADVAARDRIREGLARTHRCEWDYPFVWEKWVRGN